MRIVGGKYSGLGLATPSDQTIRPTTDRVRESLFNILSHRDAQFFHEKRVLDLFAGTGALGFEALSRGAKSVVFVEQSAAARAIIQNNIESFSAQRNARILRRDATKLGVIGTMPPFDIVFADPPYGCGLGERAFQAALDGGWLRQGATLVLEEKTEATITLPQQFYLDDQRFYRGTTLHVYRLV